MSVINVTPQGTPSPTGKVTSTGTEYEVSYYVETNDPNDAAQVVLAHANLPPINSVYRFGNDKDDNSFLQTLSASRIDPRRWRITCNYGPSALSEKNNQGEPEQDPLKQRPTVETTFQQMTKHCFDPYFVGVANTEQVRGFNRNILGPEANPVYVNGQRGPAKNSSGEIFYPPPEVDDSRMLIRITRNERGFNGGYTSYINRINSDNVRLKNLENQMFIKSTLKMQSVQSIKKQQVMRGLIEITEAGLIHLGWVTMLVDYWQHAFELAVAPFDAHMQYGWDLVTLDWGYDVRATPGDKDGNQGTINKSNVYPINDKIPLRQAITDGRGFSLSQPQALNGRGRVLDTQIGAPRFENGILIPAPKPVTMEGVFLVYQVYQGVPFAPLRL